MQKNDEQVRIIKDISGVNPRKCMKCGKCSASCPAFEGMDIRPHQFVMLVEKGDIEALKKSKSLWNCMSCFACVERCPRDVKPAKLIEAVRVSVLRQRDGNHFKPDNIPELLNEDIPQQAIVSALRKYSK